MNKIMQPFPPKKQYIYILYEKTRNYSLDFTAEKFKIMNATSRSV